MMIPLDNLLEPLDHVNDLKIIFSSSYSVTEKNKLSKEQVLI